MSEAPAPDRFEVANVLFPVEANLSCHYEVLRAQFTGFIVTVTAAVLALYDEATGIAAWKMAVFLIVVGIVAMLGCARIGHAHTFHWKHATMLRKILVRLDPGKIGAKHEEISHEHARAKPFDFISTNRMWELINLFVPCSSAIFLMIGRG